MASKISVFYLILISVPVIAIAVVVFQNGLFVSHDGVNHVARFAAYIRAFQELHIPPRWAGYLNYGYGSPVFNFFYPLPGYVAALLSLVIPNPTMIFKIISYLAFLAAPVSFFLWTSSFLSKRYAAAVSAMYGLSLYHIANLLVRGDVAELLGIAFIPLVFLAIERKATVMTMITGGIWYALAILSHNGISLLFTPVIVFYMTMRFIEHATVRSFAHYAGMILTGLTLSVFFWVPALYEKKYTNITLFTGDFYRENFLSGLRVISAPWGFGPEVNSPGGIAPQLGAIAVLLCIALLVIAVARRSIRKTHSFWIGVVVLSAWMTMPSSDSIWNTVPFLKIIQFPWRFTAISNFALFAAIATFFVGVRPKSHGIPLLLIAASVLSVLPYIRVAGYENRPENYYTEFPGTTYYHGEATTVWSTGDFAAYPKSPVEVVSGSATISAFKKFNAEHSYTIKAMTTADIVDNTLYYPGWQVHINGKKIPIEFQNQMHRGLITYRVSPGQNNVSIHFGETPVRLASDIISGIMLIVVIGFIFVNFKPILLRFVIPKG